MSLSYIAEIQRAFIDQHGFAPRPDAPNIPAHVPDGEYPMKLRGKLDRVRVVNGYIDCCNFEEAEEDAKR